MKSAGGLMKMKLSMPHGRGGMEIAQRSANRNNGGKTTKPATAIKARACMHHGPFGGKAPQS